MEERREHESERLQAQAKGRIGKQIVLPLSKAIEISFRGLKVRFWRSLITMSGIILAIAFLTSIWMNGAVRDAFRKLAASERAEEEIYITTSRGKAVPPAGVKLAAEAAKSGAGDDLEAIRAYLRAQKERAELAKDPPPARVRSELLDRVFGERTRFWRAQVKSLRRSGPAVVALVEGQAGTRILPITGGKDDGEFQPDLAPLLEAAGVAPPETDAQRHDLAAACALLVGQLVELDRWPESFEVTRGRRDVGPGKRGPEVTFALGVTFDERTSLTVDVKTEFSRDTGDLLSLKPRFEFMRKIYRKLVEILRDRGIAREEESAGGALLQRRRQRAQEIWLVALSLCVASVGIVNAMLMSVTERFREIGTMKCLGALDSFIVKLFLLESFFLGMVGAAAGIAIGLVLTLGQNLFLEYWTIRGVYFSSFPVLPILFRCAWAFAIGAVLAVIGAIYPAVVAARMEPVVAMRVDA